MTAAERAAFLDLLSGFIDREKEAPRPRLRKLTPELHEVLGEALTGLRSPEVNASLAKIAAQVGVSSR